jgi:hypothetical protein
VAEITEFAQTKRDMTFFAAPERIHQRSVAHQQMHGGV